MAATCGLNAGLQVRGARGGPGGFLIGMGPRRLERLPTVWADGVKVRLAATPLARLVGLALTDRDRAGPGLLIPSCRSVHTFGMRFALDLAFLDAEGAVITRRRSVKPGRVVADRRAAAVLEVPSRGAPRNGSGL